MKNEITLTGYFSLQDRFGRLMNSVVLNLLDFVFYGTKVKYIDYTFEDKDLKELAMYDCYYVESFLSCLGYRVIIEQGNDFSTRFSLSIIQFLKLIMYQGNIKFMNDCRDSYLND